MEQEGRRCREIKWNVAITASITAECGIFAETQTQRLVKMEIGAGSLTGACIGKRGQKMAKVGFGNDELYVGSMKFPDRKRHSLVVQRGNKVYVVGQFKSIECLDMFAEALEELFGGILEVITEDGK